MHLLSGNEAAAWGAVAAGCRFFAGYPITPATSILDTMLRLLPPRGGTVVQAEDEIASIGMCLGASMAGLKAMTATSGPGMSLYSENIAFAIGSEIPLVIVDVQRLGPSTGSATRGADGDVQFVRWGCSGGLPVAVLAPSDVADCYRLTAHAFNLAERFRCPVILASNKEAGLTKEGVDLDALEAPEPVDRAPAEPARPFLPFDVPPGQDVPPFLPIGAQVPVRQTSSTHGPDGYITTDPSVIREGIERLDRKLSRFTDGFGLWAYEGEPGAQTVVITYGVTARAARQALRGAAGRGVGLLILKALWPVPEAVIRAHGAGARRVVVAEMNTGLYAREVERVLGPGRVERVCRMDGGLITPDEIREVVRG